MTVPSTGSIAEANVQEWPCGVTDDCLILVPKSDTPHEMLYVAAAVIRKEAWRFSYGRKATPPRIADFPLPTGTALVARVRRYLQLAGEVERAALANAEDAIDHRVASQRLADIKANPKKLIRGTALDAWLSEIESQADDA